MTRDEQRIAKPFYTAALAAIAKMSKVGEMTIAQRASKSGIKSVESLRVAMLKLRESEHALATLLDQPVTKAA